MSSRRGLCALLGSVLAVTLVGVPVDAAGDPTVVAGYRDGPVEIAQIGAPVASLPLSPGNWVVLAKASIVSDGSVGVACSLTAGADTDLANLANKARDVRQVSLVVVHTFGTPGAAILQCERGASAVARVSWIKITAIRIGTLSNRALPGGVPVVVGSGSPEARAGYRFGPVNIPTASLGTIVSLPLPAGKWWVLAKLFTDSEGAAHSVSCRLEVGDSSSGYGVDSALDELAGGSGSVLAMEQTRRLTVSGRARVRCQASKATNARFLKIVAIRAGRLVSGTLGGSFTNRGSGTPRVHTGSKAGPVNVPESATYASMGSLTLPQGPWAVLATAYVRNKSGASTGLLHCKLSAEADYDRIDGLDVTAAAPHRRAPIVMAVVHDFGAAGGAVRLRCRSDGSPLKLYSIRIIAIRAGTPLSNTDLTPP